MNHEKFWEPGEIRNLVKFRKPGEIQGTGQDKSWKSGEMEPGEI